MPRAALGKPIEEHTDEELRALWRAGLAAYKTRRASVVVAVSDLVGEIGVTEAADTEIVDAKAALALAIQQAPPRTNTQAVSDARLALARARAANTGLQTQVGSLAALRAQLLPAATEDDATAAAAELRRRSVRP